MYHDLEHLKMCLYTATDRNETLSTVPVDNSDADINLGYDKNYFELKNCDNGAFLYLLFPVQIKNSITVDEDAVDHIPKKIPPCV